MLGCPFYGGEVANQMDAAGGNTHETPTLDEASLWDKIKHVREGGARGH